MKTILSKIAIGAVMLSPLGLALPTMASTNDWNVTGTYVAQFNYQGTDYAHDMSLSQDSSGALTGHGGSPAGANTYTWVITSGSVTGNQVNFTAQYTATADAVNPLTTMQVAGTVANDGTISGTWSDNYQGGARSGTWHTSSGMATSTATSTAATLSAQDFGVVKYDTGLGTLAGYSAGFGLTNATFANAQSVVVKLYAGTKLLQTDTATAKLGATITGSQISAPFDVSGNFDYATDDYWINTRHAQYGQSIPATRVVATVTLADGTVLTAENDTMVGDATTIYPTNPPVVIPPVDKEGCKDGGWKTATSTNGWFFKNQGQCIKWLEHKGHKTMASSTDEDGDMDASMNEHFHASFNKPAFFNTHASIGAHASVHGSH